MTTIAWDGRFLAVDKQTTADGTRRVATKARLAAAGVNTPRKVLAWAGCGPYGRFMCEWYEAGADPEKWPKFQYEGDDHAALIVATARRVEVFSAGVASYPDLTIIEENPFYAWGSGYRFALGAMDRGATAVEAVLTASRFDIFTSSDVLCFTL